MPNPIIKGSAGAIEKPYEVFFDPRRGLSVRRRYTAAGGDAALLSFEASAQAAGYNTRKLVSPVLSELEIASPEVESGSGNLIVTDQWQIVGNEITKSIYEHPNSLYLEESFPGAIGYVRAQVDEYNQRTAGEPSFVWNSNFDFTSGITGLDALAKSLFELAIKDQTSYLTGQYVLRHTTNCSAGYGGNVSDVNVWRVYTTAQLLTEVQSSTLWIQPMAGRLVTKIGAIPVPDARTNFLWGWLKKPSTETTTPDNRIEINTEYWLEQWALYDYGLAA